MADMVCNKLDKSYVRNLVAGERVSLRILNSDGSEKEVLIDDSVPTGKDAINTTLAYAAVLTDAV